MNHPAVDVGQSKVASGVAEGELLVIESEQVEDRGMEVVDVDFVFDGLEAEFIRGAMDRAAFDTTARQPHAEAVMVVVAAVDLAFVGARGGQLDRGRAPELAAGHGVR
jgi:hypothetical protein